MINDEDNHENNVNLNSSKIPILPFTDITYEPEYMLIKKDNQSNVNLKEDYLTNLFIVFPQVISLAYAI